MTDDLYMTSPNMIVKRAMRMQFDQWRCRNCHATHVLQVHHWDDPCDEHPRLGHEGLEDLVTLCDQCLEVLTRRRQQVSGTGPAGRVLSAWLTRMLGWR
jgi:hypothetical protein